MKNKKKISPIVIDFFLCYSSASLRALYLFLLSNLSVEPQVLAVRTGLKNSSFPFDRLFSYHPVRAHFLAIFFQTIVWHFKQVFYALILLILDHFLKLFELLLFYLVFRLIRNLSLFVHFLNLKNGDTGVGFGEFDSRTNFPIVIVVQVIGLGEKVVVEPKHGQLLDLLRWHYMLLHSFKNWIQ